jgi:hypothetical protein
VIEIIENSDGPAKKGTLTKDGALGSLLLRPLSDAALLASPLKDLKRKLVFDHKAISDLWIAVAWRGVS